MFYLNQLDKRLGLKGAQRALEPSPVLARIDTARKYGYTWDFITTIPYFDLVALIVENSIQNRLDSLKQREHQRLSELGIDRQEATDQDFKDFFG